MTEAPRICPFCKRKPADGYMIKWGYNPNHWHHRADDCRATFYWIGAEWIPDQEVESIGAAVLDVMPGVEPDTIVALIRSGQRFRRLRAEEIAGRVLNTDVGTVRCADNVAVALSTYLSDLSERPDPDPLNDETGWGEWVDGQYDATEASITAAIQAFIGEAKEE